MSRQNKRIHCWARGCTWKPSDGWEYVYKRCRRHKYCSFHEKESGNAHKIYKEHERKHVFKDFKDEDIKMAIHLRNEWAEKYLHKDDKPSASHPAFIRLLEKLLALPIVQRKAASDKLLKDFNIRYTK